MYLFPDNIYFDMDDTLVRTNDFMRAAIIDVLIANRDTEGLEEFKYIIEKKIPYLHYPEKFKEINRMLILAGDFIHYGKPTPLFNYFFLIPGNQPNHKPFNILSHRGETEEALTGTKGWFDQFTLAAKLGSFHLINHVDNPSKIEYLEKLHPDGNFILFDDNPLYETNVIHPYHPNIRIYDQYSKYDAYKNQKRVHKENGLFKF